MWVVVCQYATKRVGIKIPRAGGELVAAELQSDLEVVGGEIVEVLHASTHRVPVIVY